MGLWVVVLGQLREGNMSEGFVFSGVLNHLDLPWFIATLEGILFSDLAKM